MLPLLRVLRNALEERGAPTQGAHLLIAVSGGPDSTALLAAFAEVAPERNVRLTAVHVDHRLRGDESAAEGVAVATLAGRLGSGFRGLLVPVQPGPGLEERARRGRYRALSALADTEGAAWIVTAHTQDDQVETVLFRLLRGAGRGGLGGMAPVRGRLFRPLLEATRADVRRFLAARALPYAIDRSNADLRFARNRLRRLVLPVLEAEFNPRLRTHLARMARRWRDEEHLLDGLARERRRTLQVGHSLPATVAAEPPGLARRIIRAWLESATGRGVSAEHVEHVLTLAAGRVRGAVAVPGPARVLCERDRLVCRPGRAADVRPFCFPIVPGVVVHHPQGRWRLSLSPPRPRRAGEHRPPDPLHALFDADTLPGTLLVRPPAPGDRIRVLGGRTRKVQDVLMDAHIPREERPHTPVVVAGDTVLWIGGLARGTSAPVREATCRIVEGVLEPVPASEDCRS